MDRASIDESSLLAETEDLLATLDAAAFAQLNSSIDCTLASNQTRTSSSRTVGPSSSTGATPREPRRLEIQHLRRVANELENQLEVLQQHQYSHTFVRDKRAQIWQELAARQRRVRQLAESENTELKALMTKVLSGAGSDAQQIQRYCVAGLGEMRLPNHWCGTRRPPTSPDQTASVTSILTSLLARVDAQYAQVDAVLRESGMDEDLTAPRSFAEMRTRRLGEPCQFFQLSDLRLVPFDWQLVSDVTWRVNREWYIKDDPYVLVTNDRPDDTLALAYCAVHKTLGDRQRARIQLVLRRYVHETDRSVFVLLNECVGERDLAGASIRSIGFLTIRSVQLSADATDAPLTAIQSCMQLFPSVRDGSDTHARQATQRLVRLMSSVFKEDVTHIRQRVDAALLLQTTRTQCELSEQTQIKFGGDDAVH